MVNQGACVAIIGALAGCTVTEPEPDLATREDTLVTPAHWVRAESVVLGSGDLADVYYPAPPDRWRHAFEDAFPVAVVLQGGRVDKAQYQLFARHVARHGFVVVVPNHLRPFGPPGAPAVPLTEAGVITAALDTVAALDADPVSGIHKITDTSRVGLLGHSFGGVVGLQAIGGSCAIPFCTPPFELPDEVGAAVFYGTHLVPPSGIIDIATHGVGIALVRGDLDGRSSPADIEATYQILDDARALITVHGANHFGITDEAAPAGSQADPSPQSLSQEESTRAIGTWTGRWLRAELDADPIARFWIYVFGGSVDGIVTVDAAEE